MKKIMLNGIIGWEIEAADVQRAFNSANGEDVELWINSPGGSTFEGFDIYNIVKAYTGKVTAIINGLAASAASYIVMAADEIQAQGNAVFMIHNPWTFTVGDYRDLQKTTDILKGLADLSAFAYSDRTGRHDIQDLMDQSSWFFGDEIVDYGFADSMREDAEEPVSRSLAVSQAKVVFESMLAQIKMEEENRELPKSMSVQSQRRKPATSIQEVIFDKSEFTLDASEKWLRDNGFKGVKVEDVENSYRFRQEDRSHFEEGSFRTITLKDGIKADVGRLKKAYRKAESSLQGSVENSEAKNAAENNSLQPEMKSVTNNIVDLVNDNEETNEMDQKDIDKAIAQERKRVTAHLNMLERGIDPAYAIKAIKEGDEFDEVASSHYMGEAMNKRDLDARIEENPAPVTPPESTVDDKAFLASVLSKSIKPVTSEDSKND